MSTDRQHRLAAIALVGAMLLTIGGCAMQSSSSSSRTEREPVATNRNQAREGEGRAAARGSERPAPVEQPPAGQPADEPEGIEAVLAARRRGDYPEIELQEAGFTITEQVRIGSDARTDYERAIGLLRQERYAEGIALLVEVTAMAPDATAPYVDLGMAYRQSGDLERAEDALETAALLSPDNPIVQNELGIVYRRTGRFEEARTSYEKALAVFDGFHYARRNLAVLCDLYLADLQCALTNYRAYLEAAGEDAEVEIWVADIENRIGN